MGEIREPIDDTPSQKKPYKDIARIMYTCDDPCQTGDKAEDKKSDGHTWSIQQGMYGPPRSAPIDGVSRRKWIIREMIDKWWDIREILRSRSGRQEVVDDPIDDKCSHHVPKEIQGNVFRSIMLERNTIEPEPYQEKPEKNRLHIG